MKLSRVAAVGAAAIGAVATHDVIQRKHAILRNFPVVGHLRFVLERFGPELRQYIVTGNDEERPFSRDQRRWIYSSAKLENSYFGFGTDNNIESAEAWPVIKHRTFAGQGATTEQHGQESVAVPAGKVLGGPRGRRHAFRPASVVNISGMSFGSLSANAIEALNKGAALAGCWHNTGEGALSPYHRNGGDVIFQIGTAYFGCRDEQGRFDLERLKDVVASAPVKAIEVKLSQGAKPGLGGMLPGAKVSKEIAEIRGIPSGEDCASPSRHAVFGDVDSMLDFVELVAEATGLPVGIKSAVGNLDFWDHLVAEMSKDGGRGVDFVNIDGGEGGTGAAPLVFADAVAYPFRLAFASVYRRFAAAGLTDDVYFVGAGKLGLPESASVAFALGVDSVNVGREAMFALGCIQAQKCHTDECPTGVATQNAWLQRGLDPHLKSVRVGNYVVSLRRDLLKVSEAVGVVHPGLITPDDIDIAHGIESSRGLREVYGYEPGWGQLGESLQRDLVELMATPRASRHM
jgi:glutamate synthase (ferredoxin)